MPPVCFGSRYAIQRQNLETMAQSQKRAGGLFLGSMQKELAKAAPLPILFSEAHAVGVIHRLFWKMNRARAQMPEQNDTFYIYSGASNRMPDASVQADPPQQGWKLWNKLKARFSMDVLDWPDFNFAPITAPHRHPVEDYTDRQVEHVLGKLGLPFRKESFPSGQVSQSPSSTTTLFKSGQR